MKLTENEKEFIQALEARIAEGDVYSMAQWASFYTVNRPDLITEAMVPRIVAYFEKAIANGDAEAALNLGALYYAGQFVPQDYRRAIELYQIASRCEYPVIAARALCNLGYCFYYGRDLSVDYGKAFMYFAKGALQYDDPNCCYKLGDMYQFGKYVEQDNTAAYCLYQKACYNCDDNDRAYPDIMKRLGECALYGIGTDKDPVDAIKYLSTALGLLYQIVYVHQDTLAQSVLISTEKLLNEAKLALKNGVY